MSVRATIEALGVKRICECVGVGENAVYAAAAAGKFPARWYPHIRDLCKEEGIDYPDTLFNWAWGDQKTGSAA